MRIAFIKRLVYRLSSSMGAIGPYWLTQIGASKRLLLVYDLSAQPFSIGDVLVMIEASMVIQADRNLANLDFALVCDPACPTPPDVSFSSIDHENVVYNAMSLFSAAQANPTLGSLFFFRSFRQLAKFVRDNHHHYEVWPPFSEQLKGRYKYFDIFNHLISDHFARHGRLPQLRFPNFLATWARRFFRSSALGRVPVTVNIRNNPNFGTHRNADIDAWIGLFHHCLDRYPVHFFLLCASSEVDPRFRQCRNVTVAKDHNTSVEKDLAMIHESAFHLGCSSGPATIALFNTNPYLIVNTDILDGQYDGMTYDGPFLRFPFSTRSQRFYRGRETAEFLAREFSTLWSAADKEVWLAESPKDSHDAKIVDSWLR